MGRTQEERLLTGKDDDHAAWRRNTSDVNSNPENWKLIGDASKFLLDWIHNLLLPLHYPVALVQL